jgi:hypothetical protein
MRVGTKDHNIHVTLKPPLTGFYEFCEYQKNQSKFGSNSNILNEIFDIPNEISAANLTAIRRRPRVLRLRRRRVLGRACLDRTASRSSASEGPSRRKRIGRGCREEVRQDHAGEQACASRRRRTETNR